VVTAQSNVVKIATEDAEKYIGKRVMVCSKAYGVKELPNINFINLGAHFPDNPLTIVVFSGDKANFKDGVAIYDNKTVCITGTIKEYKGKPEIIITKPQDISIQ
jgi:DNA/RNA endonuclease YhcR with UshA esterase domain